MELNLLGISIGNSRIRIGTFVDGKLVESVALDNGNVTDLAGAIEQAYTPLRTRDKAPVLLASVNPALEQRVDSVVAERLGQASMRVDRDLPIPIGRQLDPETLVGDDRLLNAAAAYDTLKQACIVVDAGTAITVDLVDGAGTFHGGAIAPGAQMALNALNQNTALLPEIELAVPREAIGHNTAEAMRSGVFHGMRGLIRELSEQFAETLGTFPMIVATGGDANLLFNEYQLVDRVVPDLTLLGMLVTLRVAVEHHAD